MSLYPKLRKGGGRVGLEANGAREPHNLKHKCWQQHGLEVQLVWAQIKGHNIDRLVRTHIVQYVPGRAPHQHLL